MKKYSIKAITELINDNKLDEAMIDRLRTDSRVGVKQLMKRYDKQIAQNLLLEENFSQLTRFDNLYRENKADYIAGVDEAGRGPLAGPVVAAAVILPSDFKLLGLTDSKQITAKKRQLFFEKITKEAISYKISIVENTVIDDINILEATKQAMSDALLQLRIKPKKALIDAVALKELPFQTEAIIKGDEKSLAIAAASILAKVRRDNIMEEIDKAYPVYGFKNHKGYGTKAHLEAIDKYGLSPYHRLSFSPNRKVAQLKGELD